MSELSVRTGIPVSTIHHYRQRGLLPPPVPAGGHRLRYDDQHVRALRLIRRLREQRNLSLQRIAEILPHLLASEQEAFRPAMWDRLLTARASADPTLAAIVDVTISELSSRSLDEVTVGDVCLAAGIGKGTFYRYFDSKESAFIAAARTAADRVAGAVVATEDATAARQALPHRARARAATGARTGNERSARKAAVPRRRPRHPRSHRRGTRRHTR